MTSVKSLSFLYSVSWCIVLFRPYPALACERNILSVDPQLPGFIISGYFPEVTGRGLGGRVSSMTVHPGQETASEAPVLIGRYLMELSGAHFSQINQSLN